MTLAVVLADGCRLVEPGSFFWYLWGCFLSPYVIVVLCGGVAMASAWTRKRVA